jgi:hypothetical protein
MPIGLGAGLGIGGGRSATSSGAPGGGGAAPWSNTKSIHFDGTNEGASLASTISVTGAFTISFWFKSPGTGDNIPTIITAENAGSGAQEDFIHLYTSGYPNYFKVVNYGSIQVGPNAWNDDTWYNVVYTRDGSDDTELYVNGTSIGTSSYTGAILISRFGIKNTTNDFYGNMDEIAFWDSALSDSDRHGIRGGASAGSLGAPADLDELSATPTHWWRCGDGSDSGTTSYDVGSATAVNISLDNGAAFMSDVP